MDTLNVEKLRQLTEKLRSQGLGDEANKFATLLSEYEWLRNDRYYAKLRPGERYDRLQSHEAAAKALENVQTESYDGRNAVNSPNLAAFMVLDDLSCRCQLKQALDLVDIADRYAITDTITEILRQATSSASPAKPQLLYGDKTDPLHIHYQKHLQSLVKNVSAFQRSYVRYGSDHEETLAAWESLEKSHTDAADLLSTPII
ncbi:hypothetical protein [Undibacterium oligocarboniphilum]|uniref:Uncharacterized protein n=1 Tax=Undibacterium oligocarboniphilum TaxID=666702 RepID=A0A850QFZ7_9BURK|nr:hypothetical protein [Undibacterium oligocarboniphilum]MBC3871786.1 hypothetical protein [Undibacterium oligocarboniphilum]NVO79422.1 hypothetical protein [Undibacterium oligocarboniphilum]